MRYREATDTELTALRPLSSLTSLVLSHCWWLKGPGLSALAHLTGLRTLSLSSSDISCDGLDAVAALPSLTSLDLNFCWRLSDAGLSLLRPSTVLRHLGIAGTAVRDGGAQVEAPLLPSARA